MDQELLYTAFLNRTASLNRFALTSLTFCTTSNSLARPGICKMDEDNNLTEVVETKNIVKAADGAEADGVAVDVNSLVYVGIDS